MPTYNFKCPEHGYIEEQMTISNYEEKKEGNFAGLCSVEGCDRECKRIMGTPRVEFNTDGFYYTDRDPRTKDSTVKRGEKSAINEKYKGKIDEE